MSNRRLLFECWYFYWNLAQS